MRLLLLLLLFCPELSALEWQRVKNKHGIEVYQHALPNGLLKLKAYMLTEGCLASFEALLLDTQNAEQWLSSAQSVKVIESPSPDEHLVYTRFNAPWPIQNRDMVTYSRIFRTSNSQTQIGIQAAPNVYPMQDNYIRIEHVEASWVINQGSQNSISIEYQAIADPAGKIPYWLGNSVAKSNVFKTFKKMRERLKLYSCN
ncbi:START domain-containing protein [Pseudoalteromonas sp.]|uniref:START domain-containing protein n=1 Tax=Pseudoalteromonas sp. TaxID=53249 RepID=UPI00356AFA73